MLGRNEIVSALHDAGVEKGMTVFSHSNIAFFGRVNGANSMDDLVKVMLDCFTEALGPDGTLLLPVFTYSFGSEKLDKVFDVQRSFSQTSSMGNWLIASGNGARTRDPMLSVVAIGKKADELTNEIDRVCFGRDSIWARLHRDDALICNLNLDSGSTYLHWVEREARVPYRSDIKMSGTIVDNGGAENIDIVYTGRDLTNSLTQAKFEAYHTHSVRPGVSKVVSLGRGQIVAQATRSAKKLLERLLAEDPYVLTASAKDE